MKSKICSKCKEEKLISDFFKAPHHSDGLTSQCKKCISIRIDKYRLKNKTKLNKKQKKYDFMIKLLYPENRIFHDIKQRCNNKNSFSYKYYGERGIKCNISKDEIKFLWNRDKAYLMKRPNIHRIDNNGDYCINNCMFIDASTHSKETSYKKIRNKKGQFISCP
jgi:hypothetical protein